MYVPSTDAKGQLELAACDGVNDWQLVCPNMCKTLDDTFRHFIASPDRNLIAVWGDHPGIWTGEGRADLDHMVTSHVLIVLSCIFSEENLPTPIKSARLLTVEYNSAC